MLVFLFSRDIVRLLLEHDASTNIVDAKGSTPLHLAAWSGNADIARLLLRGHTMCNVNLTVSQNCYIASKWYICRRFVYYYSSGIENVQSYYKVKETIESTCYCVVNVLSWFL